MVSETLTDEEKGMFHQEITRGWALDYFYFYGNVPLHFAYRDGVVRGELTDLEKRNKAVTEGIWLDAYNLYMGYYGYIYRQHTLQLSLQAYIWGAREWPPESSEGRVYQTLEEIKGNLDAWMAREGWHEEDTVRRKPATRERRILLGAPDRTMRIVSIMPTGNQVIAETIVTWTEGGILRETAFAVYLLYDVDGTILIDRSYNDMVNWPSSPGTWPGVPRPEDAKPEQGQKKGWLDAYYNRYRDRRMEGKMTAPERRNRDIVEGPWVKAYNTDPDRSLFHPERYRVQLPLQKVSYSGSVAEDLETKIKEAAPDREIRVVFTYAKGNQVIAECIISWTEAGIYKETPLMAFLLFDREGLIIRDRRYITLDHLPGSEAFRQAGVI
jgi:hypothetical protein